MEGRSSKGELVDGGGKVELEDGDNILELQIAQHGGVLEEGVGGRMEDGWWEVGRLGEEVLELLVVLKVVAKVDLRWQRSRTKLEQHL